MRRIPTSAARPRAFTLVELMVCVAFLVLIILAVGVTFQSTSRAVGLSQSTMEMLSGVRATQQQLERDIAGLDRNCFLIIRPTPNPNNSLRNYDQISFISSGWFPNQTGTNNATPFNDASFSNAAFIWWGQLALELKANGGNLTTEQIAANYIPSDQSSALSSTALPSGTEDKDYVLGRNAILLFPTDSSTAGVTNPCGTAIPAYGTFSSNAANVTPVGDSAGANITKSRVAVAKMLPVDIMSQLPAIQGSPNLFCYRFASMKSVYESEENYPRRYVNGTFRMHPIMLTGVASFRIEYTDGSINAGSLVWTSPSSTVCWTSANRTTWPKALRFTYHVVDSAGRIPNGRDFVEIVRIPD